MTFVDSNVLIDVFEDDPVWSDWSAQQLELLASPPVINSLIVAELASGFDRLDQLIDKLAVLSVRLEPLTEAAAFLAGTRFRAYRRSQQGRGGVLSDFLIAAHALTLGIPLLTRDQRLYRRYFPELILIVPEAGNG